MKRKVPLFFFVDDKVYRYLSYNRAKDVLWAYSYSDKKRVMLVLSECQRKSKRGYLLSEVARLLNVNRLTVYRRIWDGSIPEPPRIHTNFGEDEPEDSKHKFDKRSGYIFNDDMIFQLYETMGNFGVGRPRIDGFKPTSKNLVDRQSLRMRLKTGRVMYVEGEKGEMIPLWKASPII